MILVKLGCVILIFQKDSKVLVEVYLLIIIDYLYNFFEFFNNVFNSFKFYDYKYK